MPDADGVYSVGGAVSPPKILNWVEPQFTEEARKKKVTGTCVLSLVVGADGMPRDVRVLQSISTGLAPKLQSVGLGLDEKARQAVQQYSFQPSLYQGQPVAVKIHINVTFRLR
ncbi:MAG TPA: energy transducer TonB [Acidobacteriaceae bacterium]